MFNNLGFLMSLDEYITYYKSNVINILFNQYRNKKISYDEFYKGKEYKIYFNLIKYYNDIYFYNRNLIKSYS